jgi:hypothetical protein
VEIDTELPAEQYDEEGRRRFNRTERLLLFENCRGKCFFCLKELDPETWSAVHLNPGARVECTIIVNGVAACEDCERKKGSLTHQELVAEYGGQDNIPRLLRCHGFTPELVRCENSVAEKDTLFCSEEHHALCQYMKDNTDGDEPQVEEVDGAGRRLFSKNQRCVIHCHCKGKCFYCGTKFKLEQPWEADHLVPWSKEGHTTVINGVVACRLCNRRKSNLTHRDFVNKYGGENGVYEYVRCHGFYDDSNKNSRRCENGTVGTRYYCEETDGECRKIRDRLRRNL